MNEQTRNWLLEILGSYDGNLESAARYMARTYRSIGGREFFRAQIAQASE